MQIFQVNNLSGKKRDGPQMLKTGLCNLMHTLWTSLRNNSLVLLAIVGKDEVFQLHLNLNPFLVGQRGPDVMGLCDGSLVRLQNHLGTVIVHMERSQDQDETGECLEGPTSMKKKPGLIWFLKSFEMVCSRIKLWTNKQLL